MKQLFTFLLLLTAVPSMAQTSSHQSPDSVRLVTTDLENYLRAYELAHADTANRQVIFQREYFDKGTIGLHDYFRLRIKSVTGFVTNQDGKRAFYAAIRPNLLTVKTQEVKIRAGLRRMKELYPDATYVNVYFVVGRWNSAGTVSENGLLIGTDMVTRTDQVPTTELNDWERANFASLDNLPYLVVHELIHTLQRTDQSNMTVLSRAINEGMCDFLAELSAGQHPNARIHAWANPRELELWSEFSAEMDQPNTSRWMYGSPKEPGRMADLGYYMGYQIVRAYYDQAIDKKQAIYDILHVNDYKAFVTASRYAEKMAARQQQAMKK